MFGISSEVYLIVLLLALLLFFVWKFIFKKLKAKRLITYSVIMAVITAPILYIITVACTLLIMMYYPNKDFDREKWFNDKEKRYEYSSSLKDDKLLDNKSKQEIRLYLGEPDYEQENTFIYYIGYKPRIIGIDPDWLRITFDKESVSTIDEYNS